MDNNYIPVYTQNSISYIEKTEHGWRIVAHHNIQNNQCTAVINPYFDYNERPFCMKDDCEKCLFLYKDRTVRKDEIS